MRNFRRASCAKTAVAIHSNSIRADLGRAGPGRWGQRPSGEMCPPARHSWRLKVGGWQLRPEETMSEGRKSGPLSPVDGADPCRGPHGTAAKAAKAAVP